MIVRRARAEDRPAVLDFASATFDGWDYIPRAWPLWLTADDGVLLVLVPGQPPDRSQPVDHDGRPLTIGRPVAVARVAIVSPREAWLEGIRVDPRVRGMDVATNLQVAELQWAAAYGVSVVRYATGERNEGSHRLGARHGFGLLSVLRSFTAGDSDLASRSDEGDASGFEAAARWAATAKRRKLLDALAAEGLVAGAGSRQRWWARVSADAVFRAGARLYEHRPWVLQELTEVAFAAHLERGEVLVLADEATGRWALAIIERETLPAEDVTLHLGLLCGDGELALRLAAAARVQAGQPIRFRLPVQDLPAVRSYEAPSAAAGFEARESTLHILARPLDAENPPPEASNRDLLLLGGLPPPAR